MCTARFSDSWGGLPTKTPSEQRLPLDRDSPVDRDPSGHRPPLDRCPFWTETPLWTEMPPSGQRPCPLDRDPWRETPWTETPWAEIPWIETPWKEHGIRDRDPLEGRWDQAARQEVTSYRDPHGKNEHTISENITLPYTLFGGGKNSKMKDSEDLRFLQRLRMHHLLKCRDVATWRSVIV